MTSNKIKSIEEVAEIARRLENEGNKIVLCHGCFDLLHIGHIRYLRQAKQMGDVLIVTITPDLYVDKGPHRPAFSEALRAESLAELNTVDYVSINKWKTAENTIRRIRHHIYVKGSDFKSIEGDQTGKLQKEADVVKEIDGQMRFTNDVVFSSTRLINRFLSNFSSDVQQYMKVFKRRYRLETIMDIVDQMASLDVLIVGDSILDDYHFCSPLGASSKDPTLALKFENSDMFCGGVLAIANHLSNFVHRVGLITVLGENDANDSFVKGNLNANIDSKFIYKPNHQTTIKRRFVEGYTMNKIIEIYFMDDSCLDGEKDDEFCRRLREEIPKYDLVISSDFGHGAINERARAIMEKESSFLTVNTQANAGNRGFHTIGKYSRANFVCLAEPELRLEVRNVKGDMRTMIETTARKLDCDCMAVTEGKHGAKITSRDGTFVDVPAFAHKVVDRVGSGDAFFALTSLAAFLKSDPEIIGFLGNIIGSLAVEIVGNQKSIDRKQVESYITSLLK